MKGHGTGPGRPVAHCLNCGEEAGGSAYCPRCGQRAVELRTGIRELAREALATVASLGRWSPATVLLPLLAFLTLLVSCVAPAPLDPRYWQLRNQPPPRALPVPVAGVSTAALRDSYGDPRSGGRSHEGIDIFAPRGTAVVSTTEGYVARLGHNALGGNVVWIMGPGGWRHYYAHLDRWSEVREGDWVEPGRVIGFVGNSGNAAAGPTHLHYGIYRSEGGTLNPYPLLAAGPGPLLAAGAGPFDTRPWRHGGG